MTTVLTEIISILVGGLTSFGQGLAQSLQQIVTAMFLTGDGTTNNPYALSVFGGVICIFGGISLAVGISRWVLNFITSLGVRNR